jgi:eukaryotic-like serine/threonine-protein kinase
MADTPTALFLAFQEAIAGRFSLDREIGRGGMGVVYLAREVRLDRLVAIKLLPPQFADHAVLRERFLREARTAARLSHPNIVPIHSVDEAGGFVFYTMTYVHGETLAQRVTSRGPMPAAEVMRLMREVAWALGYAHEQGVVHRDVKPGNILLDPAGRAMVTDFGIARVVDSADSQTMVGELVGTPEYMSPEQASGDRVDGRSDLYSLGLVGYFALTGTVPFTGSTQAVLAQQITKDAPPVSSSARGVPRGLSDAIDRCLLKDSSRRFASGAELADALAPTNTTSGDVPAPLRVFIERRRNGGLLVLPVMSGVWGVTVVVTAGDKTPFVVMGSILVFIGVVVPVSVLLNRLRNLARIGYGPGDVASALRREFERKREEFLYDYGPTESRRERWLRRLSYAVVILGVGAASRLWLGARGIAPVDGGLRELLPPMMAFGFWGVVFSTITRRWKRFRENSDPPLARFWEGRIGRLLGRIAAWKLRGKTVATERATEVAIAMSAEDMFGALPKEMRRQLGDVPVVLNSLRQRATSAREQLASLDDSIALAERTPARDATRQKQEALVADLRSAREQVDARMSDVVTALETIRLDLLRLQSGVGSVEHITLDLAAAEEVGREADRLVAGRREVEDALRRRDG